MDHVIDVNTQFGPRPASATDLSVDVLAELMDQHGVRACCTLSTVGVLLDHNMGNAATRAACGENRALLPVATLDPTRHFSTENPFHKLSADGFKLVRFFPGAQGWSVDCAQMTRLVAGANEVGIPVMVDITASGEASRLLRSVGNHENSIVLAGVGERMVAEAIALMHDDASVYVETSHLLSLGLIGQIINTVGVERVLFGSGAPARPMGGVLGALRYAELTEAQRSAIMGLNAIAALGL